MRDWAGRARRAWAALGEGRRADVLLVGSLVSLSLLTFLDARLRFRLDVGAPRATRPDLLVVVAVLTQALPLLLRRRYPLAVLMVAGAAFVAVQCAGTFPVAADLAVFCAPYALTAYGRPVTWWALAPYAVVPVGILMLLLPPVRVNLQPLPVTALIATFSVVPGVAGFTVRRKRERRAQAGDGLVAHPGDGQNEPAPADTGARQPSGPVAALAPRERDVLGGVMRGLSNVEIGRELSLSPETVKTYVSRILRKLDVPDRTAAAVLAERHGLVRDEGDHPR